MFHQLLAGFRRGDAISEEAIRIASLCEAHGVKCRMWAPRGCKAPDVASMAGDAEDLPHEVSPDDTALLHVSSSGPCDDVFCALACRRVILYHNFTPPHFFERLDPPMAARLSAARRRLPDLAGRAGGGAWADSAFNAEELVRVGCADPKVLPLLLDTSLFGPDGGSVDSAMREQLGGLGGDVLLFAGRFAPNKRHDKLLAILAAYRRGIDPRATLVLTGSAADAPAYSAILRAAARDLGVEDAVFETGLVPSDSLRACYGAATAFVCASDHEGFCAPLLEAMAWRVPVFAAAAGAIPETMDGAGVLFSPDAPPEVVAEAIGRVVRDPALREAVLRRQDARLARFRARDEWSELAPLAGSAVG